MFINICYIIASKSQLQDDPPMASMDSSKTSKPETSTPVTSMSGTSKPGPSSMSRTPAWHIPHEYCLFYMRKSQEMQEATGWEIERCQIWTSLIFKPKLRWVLKNWGKTEVFFFYRIQFRWDLALDISILVHFPTVHCLTKRKLESQFLPIRPPYPLLPTWWFQKPMSLMFWTSQDLSSVT